MAEDKEPPTGWRAFMAFVQQWQVLLALAVGGSGLLFNFNEQRRAELGLNRDAVIAARAGLVREEFRRDPQNTLAEFQATFPEHAYCAALGFFIAEGGRLSRESPGRPDEAVKDVTDALLTRVEAQAREVGIGSETFQAALTDALAAAAPAGDAPPCVDTAVPRTFGGGFFAKPECRLVVSTYLLNRCNLQRDDNRRAAAVQAEVATATVAPPPDALSDPAPVPGGAPAPVDPPPAAAAGPGEPCGGTSPLIFAQFTAGADRNRIEALREQMLQAGWQIAPAENVPQGRTRGDIRIYAEAQRPCAERLAEVVGALPEVNRPIQVISLADRYRGLPPDQMELWLPALD